MPEDTAREVKPFQFVQDVNAPNYPIPVTTEPSGEVPEPPIHPSVPRASDPNPLRAIHSNPSTEETVPSPVDGSSIQAPLIDSSQDGLKQNTSATKGRTKAPSTELPPD